MKISKMYYNSKELALGFSMLGVILFALSFYVDSLALQVIMYIVSFISLCFIMNFIYKIILLKTEIKKDLVVIKVINIIDISDISTNAGYRQNFAKYYYGIKIRSKKNTYLYFYKNILYSDSNFITYNKLSKQKKIKIEVYKKSKVIKRILTNI